MLFEHFPRLRLRTGRPLERRAILNFNGLERDGSSLNRLGIPKS
jgi:hypothetical protein